MMLSPLQETTKSTSNEWLVASMPRNEQSPVSIKVSSTMLWVSSRAPSERMRVNAISIRWREATKS